MNKESNEKLTGLYHIAYLLPTRSNLGNALFSLLIRNAPLYGASDHGYSEALYLNDPEGNGIEIYADRPKEKWDIREDGDLGLNYFEIIVEDKKELDRIRAHLKDNNISIKEINYGFMVKDNQNINILVKY